MMNHSPGMRKSQKRSFSRINMEERVQKILARAGYGSRRACEELIAAGRVRINGVVAELGSKAEAEKDTITVDNQAIPSQPKNVYYLLYKPVFVLSTNPVEGDTRRTVRDLVPAGGHLFCVGRLDFDSEGLILLTNDGDLANRLTHPRYGHSKEYRVLVGEKPDEKQLEGWRNGIVLEDGYRTAPAEVRVESGGTGKGTWLRVILHEGRNRQIREMGRLTGMYVQRIVRIGMGPLKLGRMAPGEWRELTRDELYLLRKGDAETPSRRPRRSLGRGPDRFPGGRRRETAPREGRPAGMRGDETGARRREVPLGGEDNNRRRRSAGAEPGRAERSERYQRQGSGSTEPGRAERPERYQRQGSASTESGGAERPERYPRQGSGETDRERGGRPARSPRPAQKPARGERAESVADTRRPARSRPGRSRR